MSENYVPPNKSALLEVIRTEREKLTALYEGLPESKMIEPGVEASWSIKDILAHIAAWERLAMDRVHAAQTGEALKYPVYDSDNFVDDLNALIYQENQDAPLDKVTADFEAVFRDFFAQIEALGENLLNQELGFAWSGDLTYQVMISSNTHWHYVEHAESIRKWRST